LFPKPSRHILPTYTRHISCCLCDSIIYVTEKIYNEQTSEQSLSSLDNFIEVDYYFGLIEESIELLMFTETNFHLGW
jgi:hypothetical protein